jgi:hypothetical protein
MASGYVDWRPRDHRADSGRGRARRYHRCADLAGAKDLQEIQQISTQQMEAESSRRLGGSGRRDCFTGDRSTGHQHWRAHSSCLRLRSKDFDGIATRARHSILGDSHLVVSNGWLWRRHAK